MIDQIVQFVNYVRFVDFQQLFKRPSQQWCGRLPVLHGTELRLHSAARPVSAAFSGAAHSIYSIPSSAAMDAWSWNWEA